ncbi:MAG: serine/threonine-protein kinase [Phycisphaerales bacterium]
MSDARFGDDRATLIRALRALGAELREQAAVDTLRLGGFTLLHRVGEGAVAEVFAARRDGEESALFAVKIVKPGCDGPETIARFERERSILERLGHPGLVPVVDSGLSGDARPWFAMPLVAGLPITHAADEAGLDLGGRTRLMHAVLDAVATAHRAGIVHRDLKPGNVLAEADPAAARGAFPLAPRVIDFGVARALGIGGDGLTPTGHAHRLGTPEYMPPEQWQLGVAACDARSDVFSLGMMLGELAAGVLPREQADRESPRSTSEGTRRRRRRHPPGSPIAPSAAFAAWLGRDRVAAIAAAARRGFERPEALLEALATSIDPLVLPALSTDPEARDRDAAAFAARIRA